MRTTASRGRSVRLELCDDGRVRYTMKRPWRDGTLALVFEPEDLLARLCAMVPPPRWHLNRFHGVVSAHASLRSEVIPSACADEDDPATCHGAQLELFPSTTATPGKDDATSDGDRQPREPSRKPWAWLLRHVFAADLQTCECCGGRMRWKEVATTADAIARLLARHGLSSGPGPPTPRPRARAPVPEQLGFGFAS